MPSSQHPTHHHLLRKIDPILPHPTIKRLHDYLLYIHKKGMLFEGPLSGSPRKLVQTSRFKTKPLKAMHDINADQYYCRACKISVREQSRRPCTAKPISRLAWQDRLLSTTRSMKKSFLGLPDTHTRVVIGQECLSLWDPRKGGNFWDLKFRFCPE